MKIGAIIVLYNPNDDVMNNIESVIDITKNVYVIDNSLKINQKIVTYLEDKHCYYYSFGENMGIASALKYGMQIAINDNCDWVLTMDQDSFIPKLENNTLYKILEENIDSKYGIISFNFNNSLKSNKELEEVDSWITSGNFINVKNYNLISGFREELFIDYVDFDLNYQFKKKNLKIAILPELSIKHQIGNPIKINLLFIKFTCMNHSPIRYYYRFRNSRFLYQESPKIYRKKYFHERYIEYFKVLFFEPNKKKKISMMKKGIKDAKNNKMGKYKD